MHNLQLTEEQDLIVDTVRKFTAEVVAQSVLHRDEHRELLQSEWDGMAELGLCGLPIAEQHGGVGLGALSFVAALEVLGAQSSSLARLLVGQVQAAMALAGTGKQSEVLAEWLAGSELAVFLGPEHKLAWRDGSLHGTAELVPGGMPARRFVAVATSEDGLLLCLVDAAAVQRAALNSLGLASTGPARLQFAGAAAVELVRGEAAQSAIDQAQLLGWLGVAAISCGGGAESVQAARRHASERIAFGKPLLVQEAVLRKLVECQRAIDAARHLTWHAARVLDLGQDASEPVLQARIAACDAMVAAADEAIQILGGYGYTVEYHVERHYRDGKTLEVLDGGSERLRDRLALRQFAGS